MSVAVESDLSSLSNTIKGLKQKRSSLELQLVSAVEGCAELTDARGEGLIEGFLGRFYQPVSIPQKSPGREEISAEIEAINESLNRLRPIYASVKERVDRETEGKLMPAYISALERLDSAVALAVEANEAVRAIEAKFPRPLSFSMSWDALGFLGWGFGTSLRDWRQTAKSFLKSKQGAA